MPVPSLDDPGMVKPMPMFKSWRSYVDFEGSVMRDRRYVRSIESEEFLKTVMATAAPRKTTVEKRSILWRAQLGHEWRSEGEEPETFEVECALPPDRMKPRPDRASEGRANPKGIPCLYVATEKKTAVSEVRPWIGSYVSVGQFKPVRTLEIIDCSYNYGDPSSYLTFGGEKTLTPEEIERTVWSNIDKAFAAPIDRDDNVAAYAGTQIVAELIKSMGYDGVAYRSNFGEDGHNIALFDIAAARLMNCQLHRVDGVDIEFSGHDNMYFTKDSR